MNSLSEHEQMHVFTSFPETAQDEDTAQLLDQPTASKPSSSNYSFWQIEYYQKYFDVNTTDVFYRILSSMIPRFTNNQLLSQIKAKGPDLYGPFWVSITLIFTTAITGNIVNFFQSFGQSYTWETDFHKVTSSAAAILLYWWCVPTMLYLLALWRQHKTEITFLEMLCIYGYSLSIYIPLSVLCIIQVNMLQWIFMAIGLVLSGSVLVLTFFPIFSNDRINIYLPIMMMVFILHGLLAVGFVLYFFHVPKSQVPTTIIPTTASNSTI